MVTVTIQIGNSDNKLSQAEWAHYVEECRHWVEKHAAEVHFFGGAPTWYPWQNVAWIIVTPDHVTGRLRDELSSVRAVYNQDSVAFTVGETEFV